MHSSLRLPILAACLAAPPLAASADDLRLVWSDEFDGPAGAAPDADNWTAMTG